MDFEFISKHLKREKYPKKLIEDIIEQLKKDFRKKKFTKRIKNDVNFQKRYYKKQENRVMKHVKKRNLDSRNPSGKFFDQLEDTFINQSNFINVKKLMIKITDDGELENRAIIELEKAWKAKMKERKRKAQAMQMEHKTELMRMQFNSIRVG